MKTKEVKAKRKKVTLKDLPAKKRAAAAVKGGAISNPKGDLSGTSCWIAL